MSSDTSIYTPLAASRSEIRLLEIIDGEQTEHPIKCRLHTVSLDDKPNFCALSYIWGDPSLTVDIQIIPGPDQDSTSKITTVPVTANLAAALRHAKRQCAPVWSALGHESDRLRLWADAICINQNDLVERASQVQLMGDLYKSAEVVLAWLGEDNDGDTALAFATIKTTALEAQRCGEAGQDDFNTLEWMQRYPVLLDGDGEMGNRAWKAVSDFMLHPYWSRVWIFQELVLARRLLFATNRSVMGWDNLGIMVVQLLLLRQALDQTGMAKPGWVPNDVWARLTTPYITLNAVQNVIRFRRLPWLAREETEEVGPSNLVWRWDLASYCATEFQATNPKDHIYGVLGLTNIDIKPDYSEEKKASDAYCEFTTEWLRVVQLAPVAGSTPHYGKPLTFLGNAGIGFFGQNNGLPSWAPNFAAVAKGTGSSLRVGGGDTSADKGIFASDDRIIFVKGPSLFVRGVVVDKVLQVSEAPGEATQTDGRMRSFIADFKERHPEYIAGMPSLQAFFRLMRRDASSDVGRTAILKALAFLFILGSDSPGGLAETLPALGFSNRLDDLAEPGVAAFKVQIEFDLWLNDSFFPGLDLGQEPKRRLRCLLQGMNGPLSEVLHRGKVDFLKLSNNWHFFETEDGFLGITTGETRPGDHLCILKGGGAPVMLREEGDHYIHINTCFVVGLMDGGNDKYPWAGEKFWKDFEIR